jgi:hypothetical protein
MFMNVLSLQASAYLPWIAGRVLWRKWRKLAPVSPVAELLDRLVVLLGLLDAVYYIPCMLVLMQVGRLVEWIPALAGLAISVSVSYPACSVLGSYHPPRR